MPFKDRLKKLLDTKTVDGKRVTAYRIGKDTRVGRVSIDNYLAGRQVPSLEYATIIAQYFNVSVDWLINGEDENTDDLYENEMDQQQMIPLSYLNRTLEQIDELLEQQKKLIDTVNAQAELLKKANQDARWEENATCANVSGSDLVK